MKKTFIGVSLDTLGRLQLLGAIADSSLTIAAARPNEIDGVSFWFNVLVLLV